MIDNKYSKGWIDLMEKEESFRKAVGFYNKNTSLDIQTKDILLSFENRIGRLITTRLMSEGYIKTEAIEQVWAELVHLVFYGEESVSAWAISSLNKISYNKLKNIREDIGRLCLTYAAEAAEQPQDEIALRFGLRLLYELGCKDAMLQYLEKYKEILELDEEDILYYQSVNE